MDNVEHPGLIYMAQAREAFVQWKSLRNSGLTHETFAACIQSMGAIPELAVYLIRNHGFVYVLPGKSNQIKQVYFMRTRKVPTGKTNKKKQHKQSLF